MARRFEQDEDLWGLTGMFHDLDQDHTGDDAANHARLAAEWLEEAGVDERVINGVLAHAYEEYRTDLMSKAVVHADAVAGLLVAAALVRPERSAGRSMRFITRRATLDSPRPRGPNRRCWCSPTAARPAPPRRCSIPRFNSGPAAASRCST